MAAYGPAWVIPHHAEDRLRPNREESLMRKAILVVALSVLALPLTALAPPANAAPAAKPEVPTAQAAPGGGVQPNGATCYTGLCGRIVNDTNLSAYVARDWKGTSEILYQNSPPYAASSSHPAKWLSGGGATGRFEDWDTFRVDAGWKYEWTVYYRWGGIGWGSSDRRGSSTGAWIRVHDDQVVHITSQYT
jgi:hypothetical protein